MAGLPFFFSQNSTDLVVRKNIPTHAHRNPVTNGTTYRNINFRRRYKCRLSVGGFFNIKNLSPLCATIGAPVLVLCADDLIKYKIFNYHFLQSIFYDPLFITLRTVHAGLHNVIALTDFIMRMRSYF